MKRIVRKFRAVLNRFATRTGTTRPYMLGVADSKPLAGKLAVVTGGSGALGRAIVHRLAVDGATVYALGRDESRLSSLVAEAVKLGGEVYGNPLDLSDDTAVEAFFAGMPRVDILVCSAGGSERDANAPIWQQSMQVIDDVVGSNLRTTIQAVGAASRRMVAAGEGRIVCLSSVIGERGKARFSGYAAAKAGIVGFVRAAAMELGDRGIRINAVSPGQIPRGDLTPDELKWQRSSNVLGEIGSHEDIAEAVAYLVGDGGRFITGHNLVVDGGRSLGLRGEA
ncbi:MAG: SDR family oxidoreductase [Azoarcus sp. PHD]|nr:MAG: SDR family oxidoreductase [Azoarcus sp. PHD]